MPTSSSANNNAPHISLWRMIFSGLSASLVGIGLARFSYTPLIPPLIHAHWFSGNDVINLGAANLAGYLVGAIFGRPLAERIGNSNVLRMMMLTITIAFLACAFPLSVCWFFIWRLVSGIAGGMIMVLVAATLLPHVEPNRRGVTSGAIFLGIGLGIAGSGTVIPLLLELGLRDTWIGLAIISAAFTALSWSAWPDPVTGKSTHVQHQDTHSLLPRYALLVLYTQYALMAAGLVPAMVFLVDFVVHDLHENPHIGALFWTLYGLGSIIGPPLYGLLGDRLGARNALRVILTIQAMALVSLFSLHTPLILGLVAILVGTFPPGIIPVVLGRVRDLEPHSSVRQNRIWSRATTVFAASQAATGYAYAALFNASHGNHRLLFLISAIVIVIGFMIDFITVTERNDKLSFTG